MERFAVLNIHSFSLMKFWQEYFHNALTSSAYYLTIVKYIHRKTLAVFLKTVKV